jgi:hypothetical protein
MYEFKNYVMKIMSISPNRRLFRLHGNLKLTEKGKYLHVHKFELSFSKFQCTSYQPISVPDLDLSVNHVDPMMYLLYKICVFLNVAFWGGWWPDPGSLPRPSPRFG